MNVYFLVEGKRTEMRVYPKWLSSLAPRLNKVRFYHEVCTNQYVLFSGEGYPSLLNHLENAIEDVNVHGNFDYFVVCLDVETRTPKELVSEINNYLQSKQIRLNPRTRFKIIFQNRCIETWFLGNRTFYKRSPQDSDLRGYIEHYDVHDHDPELMPKPSHFPLSIAEFHTSYFKKICGERNCTYTKTHPGIVTEETFLKALVQRYQDTKHIASFGDFAELCKRF